MFSNCKARNRRNQWIKELQQYYPVDSYGSCLRNMNLPSSFIDIYEGDFKKNKRELMKNYKFDLTFMNADCDYFIDDR